MKFVAICRNLENYHHHSIQGPGAMMGYIRGEAQPCGGWQYGFGLLIAQTWNFELRLVNVSFEKIHQWNKLLSANMNNEFWHTHCQAYRAFCVLQKCEMIWLLINLCTSLQETKSLGCFHLCNLDTNCKGILTDTREPVPSGSCIVFIEWIIICAHNW